MVKFDDHIERYQREKCVSLASIIMNLAAESMIVMIYLDNTRSSSGGEGEVIGV
ncbi:hypothetical protein PILCRDRAFT_822989 [Piloderma croceum F 1598]|uniref:Uncharacterized protein n=1 Tax=Piloderma croceum (strain F 1598) TaxID=765440 RepID=A0A0C3FJY6_PILCF|nr:hypothetical protein PILCRDRAFT_822989 [Piloderma croceum F 1598]